METIKSLRIGDAVNINKYAVLDQSNNKVNTNIGVICSNIRLSKVKGYNNEYNFFVNVKMACNNILTFNTYELNN